MNRTSDAGSEDQARLRFAIDAAGEAGELTLRYFQRGGLGVEAKDDGWEVTIADREAERLLRTRIAETFPGDGVLGEEMEETPSETGWRWIIDPIDGTFSFIRGVPLYATLLAAERLGPGGESIAENVRLGVILIPPLREMAYAMRGGGAFVQVGDDEAVRARVSSCDALARATVCTTSTDYFSTPETRAAFERVDAAAGHMRGWSDAYAGLLLATGRCDAVFEPFLSPWDSAPFEPIVTEAGGMVTDWSGEATIHGTNLAASNGRVHRELVELLER